MMGSKLEPPLGKNHEPPLGKNHEQVQTQTTRELTVSPTIPIMPSFVNIDVNI